jgi:hypothetical protein
MSLETLKLEHVPDTYRVYVGLFRNVTNADHLQSQLVARNSDFEYAFIDASSVLSRLQLIGAVYKALSVLLDGTIKTPNVHSEIVCSLSSSNNVCDPVPDAFCISWFLGLTTLLCPSRSPKPTADGASRPVPRTSSS